MPWLIWISSTHYFFLIRVNLYGNVNNNVTRKDYHKLQTAIAVTVFIRGTMFTSNKPYYYMDSWQCARVHSFTSVAAFFPPHTNCQKVSYLFFFFFFRPSVTASAPIQTVFVRLHSSSELLINLLWPSDGKREIRLTSFAKHRNKTSGRNSA